MSKAVILVGARTDPHITAVGECIEKRGFECIYLDSTTPDHLSISLSSVNDGEVEIGGYLICPEKIVGVWFRQKPIVHNPAWGPFDLAKAQFRQAEWRHSLRSLYGFLPNANWVNPFSAQQVQINKPRQLNLAIQCELTIPHTLISNDSAKVLEFTKTHKQAIYKSLDWFTFPDQTGILTTKVPNTLLKNLSASIEVAPGIYQEFVPKMHELRVTVIGQKAFICKIDTPKDGLGSVDWRHAHFDNIFKVGVIDEAVKTKMLDYHRRSGLVYGAYDFMVSEDGQTYFLECNPSGQFLWIERQLGYEISDKIAAELTK